MVIVLFMFVSIIVIAIAANILHNRSNEKYEEYKEELVRVKAKRTKKIY